MDSGGTDEAVFASGSLFCSQRGAMQRRGFLFLFFLLVVAANPALALRCGSDLVEEGDTKFELLQKCGEPAASEFIGYSLNRFGERELVVEQLIYGPWSGVYYQIEVVGGEIDKIESFRDM